MTGASSSNWVQLDSILRIESSAGRNQIRHGFDSSTAQFSRWSLKIFLFSIFFCVVINMRATYSIQQAIFIIVISLYISTNIMILASSRPSGAVLGIGIFTMMFVQFLILLSLLFLFDFKIVIKQKDLFAAIVIINIINIIGSKSFFETRGMQGFNLLITPLTLGL